MTIECDNVIIVDIGIKATITRFGYSFWLNSLVLGFNDGKFTKNTYSAYY
jgi:hypothetical protein